jgi:hypothetical protein
MQFPQLTSLNGPAQNHQNPCTYLPTSSQDSSSNNMFQNWQYQYYHIHHNATHDDDHHRSARSNTYQHKLTKWESFTSADTKKPSPRVIVFTANEPARTTRLGSWKMHNWWRGNHYRPSRANQSIYQSISHAISHAISRPHPSPPPPPSWASPPWEMAAMVEWRRVSELCMYVCMYVCLFLCMQSLIVGACV